MQSVAEILAWYVVFVFSITLHEAVHAFIAEKSGVANQYTGGSISFDPLFHIKREPIGMLVFPLISIIWVGWPFGYSKISYSPIVAIKNKKKSLLISISGPLFHFIVIVIAAFLIRYCILLEVFDKPLAIFSHHIIISTARNDMVFVFAKLLSMIFTTNLLLLFYNITPIPPMDASSVVNLFLKEKGALIYQSIVEHPSFGIVGLFVVIYFFRNLFDEKIFIYVINVIYPY